MATTHKPIATTPTQGLMLGFLGTSLRLGNTLVQIDNGLKRAALGLEEQGLIELVGSDITGHFRVRLTEDGIGFQMSHKVTPPVFDKTRWSKSKRKAYPKAVQKRIKAARKNLIARIEAE